MRSISHSNAVQSVFRHAAGLLKACTPETQPSAELVELLKHTLTLLSKAGDYDVVVKRVQELENLRSLLQSAQSRVRSL